MNNQNAFERILRSLYDAMLDETRWPTNGLGQERSFGVIGRNLLRNAIDSGGSAAGRSRVGRLRESGHRESDGGERRRGRRPAGFCHEQTPVLTEQFSGMERDAFHILYLSDKIPETVFHGHAVKAVV